MVLVLGQLGLLDVAVVVGVGGLELGRERAPGIGQGGGAVVGVDLQADLVGGDLQGPRRRAA